MISTHARAVAPRLGAVGSVYSGPRARVDAPAASWISSRYFTLVALTLSLPFICLAGRPLFGDIWWVLAGGRAMVEQGQLLQADPFTFAPHVSAYFDVQWLSQLAYYAAYAVGGLEAVAVLNAAVATLTFGLLLRLAWVRSRNMAAATVSVLAAEMTALWFIHPRAQTLAFAAAAGTLCLLSAKPRLRVILALGAVEAVWANLHGSFFMGMAFTGLLLAGEVIERIIDGNWRSIALNARVRYLLAVLAVQSVASLLNPYGVGIYTYLLKFSVDPIIREHISEWLPTTVTDWPGAEFYVSVALTVVAIALARPRLKVADVLTLGLFAVLGAQAYRNIPWWGLVTAPILALALTELRVPDRLARIGQSLVTSKRQVRGNAMRAILLSVVLLGALPWARAVNPWLPQGQRTMIPAEYPEAATNFLAGQSFGGRILSEHPWGAYIDWWLFPRYQAMIDSAIEVHPAQVWLDVLTIQQGHVSWEELVDQYGVDTLMLRLETQTPFIEAVERSPRWHSVYRDEQTVIFTRTSEALS